jgi:ribosomal protein S18 acetylase RimI-like enzyme
VNWSAEEEQAFVRQQFEAQDEHYRQHYPGAAFDVILVDGRPAGRLYVARWPAEIRIMDISLLPEFRGGGVGSELVTRLQAEGRAAAKKVTIHVERFNRALSLYTRLGFSPVEERGVYLFLESS